MKEGYSFHWPAGELLYLVTPCGSHVELEVRGNVPYLADTAPAFPVSDAESEPAASEAGDDDSDADDEASAAEPDGEVALAPSKAERLRAEATSLSHLMSHRYKNPFCPSCVRAKMQFRAARRSGDVESPYKEFGDLVTADHVVLNEADKGRHGERACIVVLDRGTGYLGGYPVADKSADEAYTSLAHFAGRAAVAEFYSDNSHELRCAARQLGWPHTTSTPGRPSSNAVAERAVRSVVEGGRALLLHAGLHESWWPYAVRQFAHARNIKPDATGHRGSAVMASLSGVPVLSLRCSPPSSSSRGVSTQLCTLVPEPLLQRGLVPLPCIFCCGLL